MARQRAPLAGRRASRRVRRAASPAPSLPSPCNPPSAPTPRSQTPLLTHSRKTVSCMCVGPLLCKFARPDLPERACPNAERACRLELDQKHHHSCDQNSDLTGVSAHLSSSSISSSEESPSLLCCFVATPPSRALAAPLAGDGDTFAAPLGPPCPPPPPMLPPFPRPRAPPGALPFFAPPFSVMPTISQRPSTLRLPHQMSRDSRTS